MVRICDEMYNLGGATMISGDDQNPINCISLNVQEEGLSRVTAQKNVFYGVLQKLSASKVSNRNYAS